MPQQRTVAEAISRYGTAAASKLSNAAVSGEPEDQLRAPLETLIADLATLSGFDPGAVVTVGESSLSDLKTRPDYAVTVRNALVGFIEVKAPGKGADPRRFRDKHDKELAAYRAVWTALLPVHRAAMALRPAFDWAPGPGETEASRKQARIKAFAESFTPFSEVVWLHRPFYPEEVFASLSELLRLMNSEAIAYQRFDPNREDYWDKAEASAKAINERVESIASAIRQRLSRVRVA